MTLVCQEEGGDWHFDADSALYYRVLDNGVNARISGRYLPNPSEIRASYNRNVTVPTRALWNHWQEVLNAN